VNAPRRLIEALLVLALVLGGLSALNVLQAIGRPFGGYLAIRNPAGAAWQVEASTPPWWLVLASGLVRYSDDLLALDGEPYGPNAAEAFARAAARGSLPLTLQRGASTLTQSLPVTAFTFSNFLDLKLPDLINGFGFWVLALAVYRARPQAPLNRVFALTGGLLALLQWLTIEGLFPESDAATRLLRLMWAAAAPFLGVTFLHLVALFPQPLPHAAYGLRMLYVLAAALAIAYVLALGARWAGVESALNENVITFCFRAALAGFGLATAAYLVRLGMWLARPGLTSRLRRQLLLLLAGLLLALPHIVAILLATLGDGAQSYFWNGLDLRYLTLAVPLSFAVVILRYQTFQSDHPVLAGMLALVGSALFASVGAWLLNLARPDWIARLGGSPFPLLFVGGLALSFFVLTALQTAQLRRLPQQVARAEERERLRLAQELHDTTQQFLGRLPFYLHVSRDAIAERPEEAAATLSRLIDEVESEAQILRQIRQNLAPTQLTHSLRPPLFALAERFERENRIATRVDFAPELDARLAPEARHALYRVVQQALDNVAAHAQAKTVSISLTMAGDRARLTVADDGCGFTPEQSAQAEAQGSFGLISMRARIASLGGEFSLESAPGHGTRLEAWLPLPTRNEFRA
jgi:signal transduction histidine kinase